MMNQSGRSPVSVPDRLAARARSVPGGERWLGDLPRTCESIAQQWGLTLGVAFPDCHVSLVLPAVTRDGAGVVVKILMPMHLELGTLLGDARRGEAVALRRWAGRGAVELLAHDHGRGALLMERCEPGATLDTLPTAEADLVAAGLLRELHAAEVDDQLPLLGDRARGVGASLPRRWAALGRPFGRDLVDSAVVAVDALVQQPTARVALHGDLHQHNILAARRRPWLAIDPLPARGDAAYDLVQYLLFRKGDLADPEHQWGAVIEHVCHLAGQDSGRVLRWTLVRLVSDAVAGLEQGGSLDELEGTHGDLWTARLARELLAS